MLTSTCSLCLKPSTQSLKGYKVYSAIQQKSEIKTGFKQYEIRTQTFDPQPHRFQVCIGCRNKFEYIIPGVIIVGAVLLATLLSAIDFLDTGLFLTILCFWLPLIAGAISLNKEYFGLNAKLKNLAVKERAATNWKQSINLIFERDPRYLRAKSDATLVGLTESEIQKHLKKKI